MKLWQNTNELIKSNKIKELVQLGKELKEMDYQDWIQYLLRELFETRDDKTRNMIAQVMGELQCEEAVEILFYFLEDPSLRKDRQIFLYSLLNLKAESALPELISLLYEGNSEIQEVLYSVLEKKKTEISEKQKQKCSVWIEEKRKEFEKNLILLQQIQDCIFK